MQIISWIELCTTAREVWLLYFRMVVIKLNTKLNFLGVNTFYLKFHHCNLLLYLPCHHMCFSHKSNFHYLRTMYFNQLNLQER